MTTTALLEPPTRTFGDLAATAHFEAPTRFDVHQVDAFESWVAEARAAGARRLVVGCDRIAFMDVAAVEAVDGAAGDGEGGLILSDLSPAAKLTFELLAAAAGSPMAVAA